MRQFQSSAPLYREVHGGAIRLVVFYEANPDDIAVVVFEEEANALEATCIASPATSA